MASSALEVMDQVGVIIVSPGGQLYTNQAGGYACRHPVVHGRYDLLERLYRGVGTSAERGTAGLCDRLQDYFTGPKWNGWCTDGIDEDTAAAVDALLTLYCVPLHVDRARLADSMEAWIWCRTIPFNDGIGAQAADVPAVLTWVNSD